MILNIFLIIAGVALVLWGADRLTEGAASLARRMNVPEIVIGLTIVAAGTSAPELFVSVVSAVNNTPDLAVGNVVGSNIMNTLLIVGVTALVAPMAISQTTVRKDIPFATMASMLLVVLCMDQWESTSLCGNTISRWDGVFLLAGFAIFMWYNFKVAKNMPAAEETGEAKSLPVWKSLLFSVIGLACLVVGSNVFVSAASAVAQALGVKESVIGLTIVAGGTSLPELATSVVAARKGQSAIAIGNVLGSNVFNVLFILGTTAVICPMQIGDITLIDLSVVLCSIVLVWIFSYTKYTIEKWEGAVLTLGYVCYASWLLYNT